MPSTWWKSINTSCKARGIYQEELKANLGLLYVSEPKPMNENWKEANFNSVK